MLVELSGRVALITGASKGLGLAMATEFAASGADVAILARRPDVLEEAKAQVERTARGRVAAVPCDVAKAEDCRAAYDAATSAFGKVDILVNNAGYTLDAPIHKMSDEWFQRMLDIHVIVPFRMSRAVAPHMREPAKKEREEGREVFRKIVNVSSISGTMGNAGQANYSAAKSAVVGLTKTLAKEWGQFKINVNAVAFGFIETRLTAAKSDENVADIGGEKVQLGIPEQMRAMGAMVIPLGRPGTPQEAAGGVFFLCSPWSNFVHGQVLNVTGGQFSGMTT